MIRPNLYDALLYLRVEEDPILIWKHPAVNDGDMDNFDEDGVVIHDT